MSDDPVIFDFVYTESTRQDLRRFNNKDLAIVFDLLESLLKDPTERNPNVRRLSPADTRPVLQISRRQVTLVYVLLEPRVIELVAATPYSLGFD